MGFVGQQFLARQDRDPRLAFLFEESFLIARRNEAALQKAAIRKVALKVVRVHFDGGDDADMTQTESGPLLSRHLQLSVVVL